MTTADVRAEPKGQAWKVLQGYDVVAQLARLVKRGTHKNNVPVS